MGCDIHSYVECQNNDKSWTPEPWEVVTQYEDGPFGWQSYSLFGWLADVRNLSEVPPIASPRGLPVDVSGTVRERYDYWDGDGHSHTWLAVDELLAYDYDSTFEDRRVTPGYTYIGRTGTIRDFLGDDFFRDLDTLRTLNAQHPTRVVFWFDN